MGRSSKKGPYVDPKLMKKVLQMSETGQKLPVRTWSRRSTVLPEFVGHTFEIHNGKIFHRLYVTEEMVGHKLGEFSPTRTFRGHSGRRATEEAAASPPGARAPTARGTQG